MYNSFPKENIELLALALEISDFGMVAKSWDSCDKEITRRISHYLTNEIVDMNDPDHITLKDVKRHFKGKIRLGDEEIGGDPDKLYVVTWEGTDRNVIRKLITDINVVKDGEEIKHFEVFFGNENETEESIFVNMVQIYKRVELENLKDTMFTHKLPKLTEEFLRTYHSNNLQYRYYSGAVKLISERCFNENGESIAVFGLKGNRYRPLLVIRSPYIKDRAYLCFREDQDGREDDFDTFDKVLNFTDIDIIDDNIIVIKFLLRSYGEEVAKEIKKAFCYVQKEEGV